MSTEAICGSYLVSNGSLERCVYVVRQLGRRRLLFVKLR